MHSAHYATNSILQKRKTKSLALEKLLCQQNNDINMYLNIFLGCESWMWANNKQSGSLQLQKRIFNSLQGYKYQWVIDAIQHHYIVKK